MSDDLNPYPGNLRKHEVERRDAHVSGLEWSLNVEAVNHAHEKALRESCEAALVARDATIAELRSEVEEQARLLGAGASREAALMAEVDRCKKVAQVTPEDVRQWLASIQCHCAAGSGDTFIPSAHTAISSFINSRLTALSKLAENGITPSNNARN